MSIPISDRLKGFFVYGLLLSGAIAKPRDYYDLPITGRIGFHCFFAIIIAVQCTVISVVLERAILFIVETFAWPQAVMVELNNRMLALIHHVNGPPQEPAIQAEIAEHPLHPGPLDQ